MPTPAPIRTVVAMDFGDALRDVVRGCRITRHEWQNGDRVFLQAGFLHISIAEDRPELGIKHGLHRFLVSEGDLLANDWIVARD